MTTRRVNLNFTEPTSQDHTVNFRPDQTSLGGSLLLEEVYSATTTAGIGSIDLPCKASGSILWHWEIVGVSTGIFLLDAGTAVDFDALVAAGGAADDSVKAYIDLVLAGATVGVPTTRTVNSHPLSADVVVTASDVGLGSVDNTADSAKPVSTAQQTALDLKQNALGFTAVPNTRTVNGHALSADVTVSKSDVGLGSADNTADADKPVSTLQAAADAAARDAAKAYADTLVVGLIDDRGNYNASGNTFPASGGSGSAGAVLKGDMWTVSVAGTLGGHPVTAGDVVRALTDTPGQTDANWAITENNFGYVAENAANKDASGGYAGLTLFKINFKNALNTFTSFLTNANTAARTYTFQNRDGTIADDTDLAGKQATLVSGTNLKTVNSTSLLGSGDVAIPSPSIGGGITGATAGSILFAATGPVFAQNNTALFWDDANTQLILTAGAATKTPFKIIAAASQSGDLVQIFASDGTTKKFSVASSGKITVPGLGYGPANAGFVFSTGSTISSSGDGNFWFGSVGNATTGVLINGIANAAVVLGVGGQFKWNAGTNAGDAAEDTGLKRRIAKFCGPTDGGSGGGGIWLKEMTAPATPAADEVYIYAVDNGAGKTQVMALFSSGAAQQIAIQP